VDIWLNNPRRPHEASGTSGQKAALCGVPNFSVLDGWWVEGYNGENGWSIGEEREYKDEATQDEADVLSLYQTLEEEIIPLYFDRDAEDTPHGWVQKMKAAIMSCAPQFSMQRMVKEYTTRYYVPAASTGARFAAENFSVAREVALWKARMRQRWASLHVEGELVGSNQADVGEPVLVQARLWLNGLPAEAVAVEVVAGIQGKSGELVAPQVVPMQQTGEENGALLYQGALTPDNSGVIALGVRARPDHPALVHPNELGMSKWA
jgi:glycogen phosphorylase